MARPRKATIYRARESFVGNDGISVARGDLASADANRPGGDDLWEPVTERDYVRFFQEDEKATAAPGEKRGAAPVDEDAGVEDFDAMTLAELKDLAHERGVTPGSMNKHDLIDAIKLRGQ